MIGLSARVPLARLRRTPRGLVPIIGWSALAIALALATRAPNGADRTVRGTFAFAVVPLLSYGIVSAAMGGRGLRDAVRGIVAVGASRDAAAKATLLVAMGASALACGGLAALVVILAHGSADAPIAADAPASFVVGALAGGAYAAYFSAGSAIGSGVFRGLFLVLDALLGASLGLGSLLVPRGHVTSLFGGVPAFDVSRRGSSVALVVLGTLFALLALGLARRPDR